MTYRVGDIVQISRWGDIVLFELTSFLPPPHWKSTQDARLRVIWKTTGRDLMPSWPIGTHTVECASGLQEPDNAMLAIALAAELP